MASGGAGVGVWHVHPGVFVGDLWVVAVCADLGWTGCGFVDRGCTVVPVRDRWVLLVVTCMRRMDAVDAVD